MRFYIIYFTRCQRINYRCTNELILFISVNLIETIAKVPHSSKWDSVLIAVIAF